MPGRLKWVASTTGKFSLVLLMTLATFGCGKPPSAATVERDSHSTDAKTDSTFAVPDGTPEKILAFVHELRDRRPKFSSREQMVDHVRKIQHAMIEAGDRILAQEADDAALREAVTVKLIATMGTAIDQSTTTSQAEASAKDALDIVNRLRDDKRKVVAEVANEFVIAARALNLQSLSSGERAQLFDEAVQSVTATKASVVAVRNVDFLTDQYLKVGEIESAASLCDRMTALLDESSDESDKAYVSHFRDKAGRIRLPGSQLELKGKLLDGSDLDWASYRGQVVLVEFWATWCGPCVAELPTVKAIYDQYHSRGFNVVGINLDQSRQKLESFLKQQPLPWVQLFEEPDSSGKPKPHPIAEKYGITTIPAAFLVDREGKIVSLEARGPELELQLKKLFESAN